MTDRPSFTTDVFQRGRFALKQSRDGHRAGTDALILAATVRPTEQSFRLVDLGSGSGAVALSVLARCPEAIATLVERDPVALQCARETLRLPENAALASRARIMDGDIGAIGDLNGLQRGGQDLVLCNPPFNLESHRISTDARRRTAHALDGNTLAPWIAAAAFLLRPRGTFTMIVRPESLLDILVHWTTRFGGPMLRPVYMNHQGPAARMLVSGRSGTREPLRALRPVEMRDEAGPTALGTAVADGTAWIAMD